jgi:hypothetical protein
VCACLLRPFHWNIPVPFQAARVAHLSTCSRSSSTNIHPVTLGFHSPGAEPRGALPRTEVVDRTGLASRPWQRREMHCLSLLCLPIPLPLQDSLVVPILSPIVAADLPGSATYRQRGPVTGCVPRRAQDGFADSARTFLHRADPRVLCSSVSHGVNPSMLCALDRHSPLACESFQLQLPIPPSRTRSFVSSFLVTQPFGHSGILTSHNPARLRPLIGSLTSPRPCRLHCVQSAVAVSP